MEEDTIFKTKVIIFIFYSSTWYYYTRTSDLLLISVRAVLGPWAWHRSTRRCWRVHCGSCCCLSATESATVCAMAATLCAMADTVCALAATMCAIAATMCAIQAMMCAAAAAVYVLAVTEHLQNIVIDGRANKCIVFVVVRRRITVSVATKK